MERYTARDNLKRRYLVIARRGDTLGIMAKLPQTAGDGNFDYLVQFSGPGY
jgi:hypothetical protein